MNCYENHLETKTYDFWRTKIEVENDYRNEVDVLTAVIYILLFSRNDCFSGTVDCMSQKVKN